MVQLTFSRKTFRNRFDDFKHLFRFISSSSARIKTIKGKTIIVTGILRRYSRKDIEKIIQDLGGRNETKVSYSTSFLVVTDKMKLSGRATSKMVSAKRWGVPVVSEDDLYEVIDKELKKR